MADGPVTNPVTQKHAPNNDDDDLTKLFSLPPLYALVIGINAYTDPRFPNLHCATKDADDFNEYLTSKLHVPRSHIINLRDTDATRDAILHAFEELKILTSPSSADYDGDESVGIIVFFAGHGARGEKPKEWGDDWITIGDYYEALCPSDMGILRTREREVVENGYAGKKVTNTIFEEREVPAIPDRTVAALVNRLSETRGNNITLIFDCCHSAGASRTTDIEDSEPFREGYIQRHIPFPPTLPHDYDDHIISSLSRLGSYGGTARGFSGKYLSSHVLLAACGKDQSAHEHPKRPNGVFTYALMKVLNDSEVAVEMLTYTSLMHRLSMPKWQNAHSEGVEANRRLFNHKITGGDPSFILGFRSRSGDLTLNAGLIQSITVGCTVSVHQHNLLPTPQQQNPSLIKLVVTAVDQISATLSLPPPVGSNSSARNLDSLYRLFYCRVLQRLTESLTISSNNISWLESTFKANIRTSLSVTIVSDIKTADLVFTLKGDKVYIDHNFPLVAAYIGTRSPHIISSSNVWLLQQIVRSVITFRFHLLRTNPNPSSKIDVKMGFYELGMTYDAEFDLISKPISGDMFQRDPAIVVVEKDKQYGAKIHNDTNLPLYPYLFYFDPSELAIIPWYLPPTGAGASLSYLKTDVILPPKSVFSIGYGEGGIDPWEFFLDDVTKDVGFFKLFVTTAPVDIGSISQDSPYSDSSGTHRLGEVSGKPKLELDLRVWDTVVKAVVQVEVGGRV